MKITSAITLFFCFIFTLSIVSAQTTFNEIKVGHVVSVSLPDYMNRTGGLNTSAIIQYKSVVKDVYGFIIEDNKVDLDLIEMKYNSITEFYEDFIKDFLKDEEKRTISKPQYQKKGDINFVECDASYYDKDLKVEIFYLVGVVETKTSFYKVISWSSLENKAKFKADFQKILYSLKD